MPIVDRSQIAISGPRGRYNRNATSRARMPADGLPRLKRNRNRPTETAVVDDPWGRPGDMLFATVSTADVLESEYAQRRITEAAYEVGRIIQNTFEHTKRVSSSSWSPNAVKNGFGATEHAVATQLDRAKTAVKLMARIEVSIGRVGARFLRLIISEGTTFKQAAAMRGQTSERAATYAGDRFRTLLEDLADDWAVRGKTGAQIVASLAEAPDAVMVEPRARTAPVPIVHGRSAATAGIGARALDAATVAADRPSKAQVVRRGLRPRD